MQTCQYTSMVYSKCKLGSIMLAHQDIKQTPHTAFLHQCTYLSIGRRFLYVNITHFYLLDDYFPQNKYTHLIRENTAHLTVAIWVTSRAVLFREVKPNFEDFISGSRNWRKFRSECKQCSCKISTRERIAATCLRNQWFTFTIKMLETFIMASISARTKIRLLKAEKNPLSVWPIQTHQNKQRRHFYFKKTVWSTFTAFEFVCFIVCVRLFFCKSYTCFRHWLKVLINYFVRS